MSYELFAAVSVAMVVLAFINEKYLVRLHEQAVFHELCRPRDIERQSINRGVVQVHTERVLEPAQACDVRYLVVARVCLVLLLVLPWLSRNDDAMVYLCCAMVLVVAAMICLTLFIRYDYVKADNEWRLQHNPNLIKVPTR